MSSLEAHTGSQAVPVVRDGELPAASALLGSAAPEILAAAVAQYGGSIGSLRPSFVDYWPGRRMHVRYSAAVVYPAGTRRDTLVAVADRHGPPPAPAVPVELADGSRVGVWRFPDDPALPGLAAAIDPAFVRDLLDELGLSEPSPRISTLGYSPGSRAVIEISRDRPNRVMVGPGMRPRWARSLPLLYLKVRRPARAAIVRRSHELLAGLLPAPRCLAYDEELGLLALAPVQGQPIWDRLGAGAMAPDAEALLALLDGLDGVVIDHPSARPTVSESVRMNAAMLTAVVPERARAVEAFVELLGPDAPQPLANVHGDFHEMQVLVDSLGAVSGILDLDDSGAGQRIDDLAMMIGRLACFAETEPDPHKRVGAYVQGLTDGFSRHADGRELRRRAAGVAFNHATGPFRFQAPHWRSHTHQAIDRAHRFLAAAAAA